MSGDDEIKVDGLTIRRSVLRAVESCAAAARAWIRPKDLPCGYRCDMYNKHRQCIECGWLRPLTGDDVYREMPMGPSRMTRLGLTHDEITYVMQMGV